MENWKDIDGYSGKYQVSDHGKVRSLSAWSKGKELKGGLTKGNPHQYRYVLLVGKGRKDIKTKYIHRLVAEAFIENPNDYEEVNHIDGNTLNNFADNLEWCTHKIIWNTQVKWGCCQKVRTTGKAEKTHIQKRSCNLQRMEIL